jgi:hypothetical protein
MKTSQACLIASVVLGLPSIASAQSAADLQYCSALAEKYTGFLAVSSPGSPRDPQEVSGRVGMEQCRAGSTTVGIPLLESSLRNAGLDLPPRDTARPVTRVTHGHAKGG